MLNGDEILALDAWIKRELNLDVSMFKPVAGQPVGALLMTSGSIAPGKSHWFERFIKTFEVVAEIQRTPGGDCTHACRLRVKYQHGDLELNAGGNSVDTTLYLLPGTGKRQPRWLTSALATCGA